MKIAVIALCAALTGCATCKQHPSVCAAGAVIVGTSIALSLQKPDDRTQPNYYKPIVR